MANKLYIDGVDVTDCTEGLDSLTVEYRIREDKTYGYSTSSSVEIRGKGYELIKDKFFTGCQGQSQTSKVLYYDECCDLTLEFDIEYEDVRLCGETAEVELTKIPDERSCYNYLKKTVWFSKGFKESQAHHTMEYCIQGGYAIELLYFLVPLVASIMAALFILCRIVKAIYDAISFIVSIVGVDIGTIPCDWADPCSVYALVRGCNRWVQTPKVIDVLKFHTSACGLRLDAPPLESPWALFDLRADGGKREDIFRTSYQSWVEDASSTDTVIELIDKLKGTFNAEYIIKDGVLHFDRKDKIQAMTRELVDLTLLGDRKTKEYCISHIQGNAYAYMRPKYCSDALEQEGNDIMRQYGHDDLIEWNEENADWKEGEKTVDVGFAPTRFMFDKKTFDDRGFYNWNFAIDKFRKDGGGNFGQLIVSGIISSLFNIFCADPVDGCPIVSQKNRTSCTKLLYLDESQPLENAKVVRRPIGIRDGYQHYDYNYPFKLLEKDDDGNTVNYGLYQDYHQIDDPNRSGREVYEVSGIEYLFDCDDLTKLHQSSCGWSVMTEWGVAYVENVKVNFSSRKLTIDRAVIRC